MDRIIFVVAQHRPELYDALRKAFAAEPAVEVLLNRRVRNRRERDTAHDVEHRRADRRARPNVSQEVRDRGWSVARIPS